MPCLCDHAAARLCHQDRNLAKAFFDSGNDCGSCAHGFDTYPTCRTSTLSASQTATTRIRLAGTQNVVAIAKMADGSFARTSNPVKVTIGGCGG